MKSWASNLALVLVSSLLTLLLAEGLVRGFDLFRPQRSAVGQAAEEAVQRVDDEEEISASTSHWVIHPFRGISPRPNGGSHREEVIYNALGILSSVNDPRNLVEEDFVVGVFGGSVARGLVVGGGHVMEEAMKDVLGTQENIKVVNFAVSGYKQPQQLTLLMELLLLRTPIDVVVNLDGFNEVVLGRSNTEVPFHPLYPHYHFWISGLGSTTGSFSSQQIDLLAESRSELNRALDIGKRLNVSWLGRSAIVRAAAGGEILKARANSTLAEQALRTLPIRKLEQDLWQLNDPCLESSEGCWDLILSLWMDSSKMMEGFCKSRNIPYFHVLQPNQYVESSKDTLHPEELQSAWAPDHPWSQWAAEAYPSLREAGESLSRQGVPFLDATQIFKSSKDKDYIDTCCHLTYLGYRKLAAEMGRWIGESLKAESGEPQPEQ